MTSQHPTTTRPSRPAPGRRAPLRAGLVLAAATVVALTVGSCGAGTDHGSDHGAASSTPGPSTSGLSTPAPSPQDGSATDHNAADTAFAQGMVVHHRGAIDMSALAADRAGSDAVRELADRIAAAQAPEIDQMTGWLAAWSPSDPSTGPSTQAHDMTGHDMTGHQDTGGSTPADTGHAAMGTAMGMMSDDDMAALTAARGPEFDRLFLQMMIVHHQGAVDMSQTELTSGQNPQALALARTIIDSQTAEIAEMRGLLGTS